jgi:CRP-like cAMP-binding protein
MKIGMSFPNLPAARLAKSRPPQRTACVSEPAMVRLAALGTLDEPARLLLADNVRRRSVIPARRELFVEGSEIKHPLLILSGWAARVRELADGRRQIISFLLPGDLVGLCGHTRPLATSTVMAVSDVAVCPAPCFGSSPALDRIYALSGALAEAYLLGHVTRLGQLNAYERLGDFLLELLERLQLAGLAADGSFTLPMTQEMLADTLGITSVHINRTIQSMRRDKSIVLNSRKLTINDPDGWSQLLGRVRPQVSAGSS